MSRDDEISRKEPLQEGYRPTKDSIKKGYSPSTAPQGPVKPPPPIVAGNKAGQGQGGSGEPAAGGRAGKDACGPA